ncbi:Mannan endo-1-6-alpha-mannosidase [Venturia nashicola]|uniref:Mannan endo-1-6-alpha-mannosidase n=1 Tax=Venturia nashicola TaxID=86259 RepID=A0A4Z1PGK5_9PEZI|nr:Mannan endo-1-6-alpha-mannosidase [Venturia nashicola]TLD35160.1 Mannan endo-1-6-alpha-mannosidase [Venturia nashicola]
MKTTKTSFFDLPPELRLKIYRNLSILRYVKPVDEVHNKIGSEMELFNRQATTDAMDGKKVASRTTTIPFRNPNAASAQFLVTCKLCLHEGLPILYGENVLVFSKCSEILYCLGLWSPRAKASVRTVIFKGMLLKRNGLSSVARGIDTLTSLRKFEFRPKSRCFLLPHMSLDTEGWKWLKRQMNGDHFPGKTFLKALFGRNPSVTCRVVQVVFTWDPPSTENFGIVRFNVIPHGNDRRTRTFSLELDTTWPVGKYKALLEEN